MRDPLDHAVLLTVQLRAALRRVRSTLPRWANQETVEAAWSANLECQALAAEEANAWAKVGRPA
jgi:hypothetical protein